MAPRPVVPVLAAAGCVLAIALGGCGGSMGAIGATARQRSGTSGSFTLMQMNLCLSGLAGCYGKVAYPAVLGEAEARIRQAHPEAVTFNEACGGDVARIARRTGYHAAFAREIYFGKPLACVSPGGRGLFGDAVLTRAAIEGSESRPFKTQADPEHRQWLCVTTDGGVDVCTAHLATRDNVEIGANDPQCAELTAVLAARAAARPVVFGGDLNRERSCAPRGFWTRTDSSAHQRPGLQQVYGTRAFRSPSARVVRAVHTDHDVLLVSASR
jgi:endonuclease/exonuclease/phosphatase family metal-dependent hydrolase